MTLSKIFGITAAVAAFGIGSVYADEPAETTKSHQTERSWKIDADQDGKVSYDEFRAAQEKRMEHHFKRMDANGDGFIDQSEKQAMHEKWGHKRKVKGERCQKKDQSKTY